MMLLTVLKIKNTNKMEIENLMANDLVYYNGKPVMLKDLWQNFLQNLQTKDNENHQDTTVIWDFDGDKISPIEISEDILLKSNFKKATTCYEEYFYYTKEDIEYFRCIELRPQNGEWLLHTKKFNIGKNSKYFLRGFDGRIKYIHELQHVLIILEIDKKIIV